MKRIFNKDLLYLIPVLFTIIALIRTFTVYNDVISQEYNFVKKQAEVLNDYMLVHRKYYQNLYISHTIPLNAKTLKGLPAFSSSIISRQFSEKNIFDITVRTVSDRARNLKNMADLDELEAIEYFKSEENDERYFASKADYYQFAHVLKIEEKCLKCHGKKEDAPLFIREKYDLAYDYKLGDVRGAVSIKIPKAVLHSFFFKQFIYSVIYDFILLTLLFIFISYLLRRIKSINQKLEFEVINKTQEISSQKAVLESYIQALDKTSIISKSDMDGVITYVNDAFVRQSGYSRDELLGKTHRVVRHPDTPEALIEKLWSTIQSKQVFTGILYWLTKDHQRLTLRVSIVPVLNEKNEIIEYIAARTDITELIQKKEELNRALLTDSLTSLPNRRQLLHILESHSAGGSLALLNIDSFKEINDFYGHMIGDKLLKEVALMLNVMCVDNVELFKLPSDEFALFADSSVHSKVFENDVRYMIKLIGQQAFNIDSYSIYISLSSGIASQHDALLIRADMALKKAKAEKKYLVVYDKNIDSSIEISKNIDGINLLKEAIKNDRIIALYQPIYDLKKNRVCKYEALVRIEDEHGYIQSPDTFLEIAKRSKLYSNITRSVIEKSFEMFANNSYEFSINLSVQDLKDHETVEFIKSKLMEFPQTERIIFEITESDEIEDYGAMKVFIKTLKAYGVKIAIDDFGSGYANFSHILELDVDFIKLDASLIKDIEERNSRILVEGIIDFSKRLNIQTIAEYVETEKSMEILRSMGVDYIQGYLIGKPSIKLLQ
ncbi:MAG: GGDEF domain-containing protein [Epsilonproteobacteria bacterium]|nr:MAG: GGDEF domain-containing protein [Campylobacterota bacterium]